MTHTLRNIATGEELDISGKMAREFFKAFSGKKIMCLPVSEEIKTNGETPKHLYEVTEFKRKKKVKGTCVIRMGGIGDLICLSSSLREMTARGDQVTLATLPQHIEFMKAMDIGKVIDIKDIGKYTFDDVIDLRFAIEPKEMGGKAEWSDYTLKDRSDYFDELVNVYPAKKSFAIQNKEHTKISVSGRYVIINASIWAAVRAIPQKYIMPLAKKINKLGLNVVLVGVSQPWNQELLKIGNGNGIVNLIDKTSILDMIDLCDKSEMIITPDTGTVHIGAGLGKKTLALFGNINPRTRTSYYTTVKALYPQGELECIPCFDMHPCIGSLDYNPGKSSKCMQLFTPDRVVNAVKELGGY